MILVSDLKMPPVPVSNKVALIFKKEKKKCFRYLDYILTHIFQLNLLDTKFHPLEAQISCNPKIYLFEQMVWAASQACCIVFAQDNNGQHDFSFNTLKTLKQQQQNTQSKKHQKTQ